MDLHDIPPVRDGRTVRWDSHNLRRREELLGHALTAIRLLGPGVGMEEIARVAGTSKPVLYRHLGDRASLHGAVTDLVGEQLHLRISTAMGGLAQWQRPTPRSAVAAVLDAYLTLVERDPEVYRFVSSGPQSPSGDDPVRRVAAAVGQQLSGYLTEAGVPEALATVWGPALAGLARAAADDWMTSTPRTPRTDLVEQLTALAWGGLRGAPIADRDDTGGSALEQGLADEASLGTPGRDGEDR